MGGDDRASTRVSYRERRTSRVSRASRTSRISNRHSLFHRGPASFPDVFPFRTSDFAYFPDVHRESRRTPMLKGRTGFMASAQKFVRRPASVYDAEVYSSKQLEAIQRIQWATRKWLYGDIQLHRKNLIERLELDHNLYLGFLRMANYVFIFVLLIFSLQTSHPAPTRMGIRKNLEAAFNFRGLESVVTRDQLGEALASVQQHASSFFPVSWSTYQASSEPVMLVDHLSTTELPVMVRNNHRFTVDVDSFSFTAWVADGAEPAMGGSILTNNHSQLGQLFLAPCYSWSLGRLGEQVFNFGAATFYETTPSYSRAPSDQPYVELRGPPSELDPARLRLLSVVVTPFNISFYEDVRLVGSLPLPRRVLDCDAEELLIGGGGISVGRLAFYPEALSANQIEEVFSTLSTLADISTGHAAASLKAVQEVVEAVGRAMVTSEAHHSKLSGDIAALVMSSQAEGMEVRAVAAAPAQQWPALAAGPGTSTEESDPATPGGPRDFVALEGDTPYTAAGGEEGALAAAHEGFTRAQVPRFNGRSASWSTWVQWDGVERSPFLFAALPNTTSTHVCWGVAMSERGFHLEVGSDALESVGEEMAVGQESALAGAGWRHVAVVLDAPARQVSVYLDGQPMGHPLQLAGAVDLLDCPVQHDSTFRLVLGRSSLHDQNHAGTLVMSAARLFLGTSLSSAEVLHLAASPPVNVTPVCLPEARFANSERWRDNEGRGCEWYRAAVQYMSSLCSWEHVRDNCPILCKRMCNPPPRSSSAFYVWDSIESRSPKVATEHSTVSLCVSDEVDQSEALEGCALRTTDPPEEDMYWRMVQSHTGSGSAVNLRDCAQLQAAVDPLCAFSAAPVRNFTQEVVAEGGSWTVFFWVRPASPESFVSTNRALRTMKLYSSLDPPRLALALVASATGIQVVVGGGCGAHAGATELDQEEGPHVDLGDGVQWDANRWTLMVISLDNSTLPSPRLRVGLDRVSFPSADTFEWKQCFGETMFQALEYNDHFKMTPMGLLPWAMSPAEQQLMYFERAPAMVDRPGAVRSVAQREALSFPVTKSKFSHKQAAVAPVMVFQRRHSISERCAHKYAQEWIEQQHRRALSSYCAAPRLCPAHVQLQPQSLVSCKSPANSDEEFFGLKPARFQGHVGYADFLQSYTEPAFIPHNGSPLTARDFVDEATSSVTVLLVFFTWELGTTTVVRLDADLDGVQEVQLQYTVNHFVVLEGHQLTRVLVVLACTLVLVLILLLDSMWWGLSYYTEWDREGTLPPAWDLAAIAADMIGAVLVTTAVGFQAMDRINSSNKTRDTVGDIASIPWEDPEVDAQTKTQTFLQEVQELLELMNYERTMKSVMELVLVALAMRMVAATSCHPRLGILTGTIFQAFDDMWHTALLVLLLMLCSATLASWKFGGEEPEFATTSRALQTQFMMMIGEFPEHWTHTAHMTTYVVVFLLIMFFLIMNFVLAIIVEAYMKVRELIEVNEVEGRVEVDLWYCFSMKLKSHLYNWPHRHALAFHLESLSIQNVGLRELSKMGIFESSASLSKFLQHYRQIEGLKPQPRPLDPTEKLVSEMEKRTALLMGLQPPERADHIRYMSRAFKKRLCQSGNKSMMINTKHNGVNSMVDNQQEESLQATLASCAAPMNKTTRDGIPDEFKSGFGPELVQKRTWRPSEDSDAYSFESIRDSQLFREFHNNVEGPPQTRPNPVVNRDSVAAVLYPLRDSGFVENMGGRLIQTGSGSHRSKKDQGDSSQGSKEDPGDHILTVRSTENGCPKVEGVQRLMPSTCSFHRDTVVSAFERPELSESEPATPTRTASGESEERSHSDHMVNYLPNMIAGESEEVRSGGFRNALKSGSQVKNPASIKADDCPFLDEEAAQGS